MDEELHGFWFVVSTGKGMSDLGDIHAGNLMNDVLTIEEPAGEILREFILQRVPCQSTQWWCTVCMGRLMKFDLCQQIASMGSFHVEVRAQGNILINIMSRHESFGYAAKDFCSIAPIPC